MPAIKYSQDYNILTEPKKTPVEKKYQSVSDKIDTNRKKIKKTKTDSVTVLNFVLLSMVGVLTLAFIGVYSFVAINETKLSNLHSQISELNYENIDLENKLENVKSYYSVDTKVASNTDFDKAKNVLEVNHVNAKTLQHSEPKTNNLNTVTGF